MDPDGFAALLRGVADGWNRGDPDRAADCFAIDAVYVEPPDAQRHVGREDLVAFFHGPGKWSLDHLLGRRFGAHY